MRMAFFMSQGVIKLSEDVNAYMQRALDLAKQALAVNEVPIGAVIIKEGEVIAEAFNSCESDKSPLAHAEIKAMQLASQKLGNWRLNDCELYVTVEPCPMCLGAIIQARVTKLYIGCFVPKRIPKDSFFSSLKGLNEIFDNNHHLEIHGGTLEDECANLIKSFFKNKRTKI